MKFRLIEEFDDIWNVLPHFSGYQLWITAVAGYISMVGGLCALFPVFGQWTPPYHCKSPLDDQFSSLTFAEISTLHQNVLGLDSCETAKFSVTQNCTHSTNFSDIEGCLKKEISNSTIESYDCQPDDFLYNMEAIGQPIDKDNMLFRSWLGSLMTSAGIIGQWLGAIFAGIYADRFGRRNAVFVFSSLMAALSIFQGVLNNEYGFIICRVLVMACSQIAYIAALTYGVELTGPSKRSIPGSLINVYFSVGYSGISLIAWFIPDWQGLSVAIGIFAAIQVFLCFFIPESPRFLAIKNEIEKAGDVLKTIASKTNTKLDENIVDELSGLTKFEKEKEKSEKTTSDLFKTTPIRLVTLNIGFSFIVVTIVYYGLAYNVSSLSGDIYVNNVINGLVECFGYFVSIPLIDRFGRRSTTGMVMLNNQLGFDSVTIQECGKWLAFIGKFCVSGAFNNIFIFASELYPTEIRTVGVGFCSMVGRVSGALSPFLLALQNKPGFGWFPYTLFAVSGFSSATLLLKLPETNNVNLTETLEEAEEFYSIKECAVCTYEFNMTDHLPSILTVCGHQICDPCVDRCLRDYARCPVCSSPLFEGDVLRHYDLFQEKPKELPGLV
ncbi:Oidioi.mRNA.OKI2018_I69.PAR.g9134.t1.cds [Oikopleura dioica]|uniref:Oidioi.mRNA.OKI2018_I69.PAR.g9134.t1.cds n=1 Tax=Oikopleura dioica TaxID=34765 RepID=A0ABN7RJ48_OIKDI|nr:Oidioi.mRNA.OKI2018_I69.PAR.g9134.t1.cds [Oikopleura dioica]